MKSLEITSNSIAMDRSSVRTFDEDGRMRISETSISKANVCPYRGNEISGYEALGLDPYKIYQLLRDPKELKAAVDTFNGIPLLDTHVTVKAWDHPSGKVVGSTGTDAVFKEPFLMNSLSVWTEGAISGIERGTCKELSCAYHYVPVMEPGTYDGVHYDGRMTKIRGNHVALVPVGRAGPDVVIGDSQLERMPMKTLSPQAAMVKGALLASKSMLALDAAIDYNAILSDITSGNYSSRKAGIVSALRPKLACDADAEGLMKLLDALECEVNPDAAADDAESAGPKAVEIEERDENDLTSKIKNALLNVLEMLGTGNGKVQAKDEPITVPPVVAEKDKDKDKDKDKSPMDKPAMDAALAEHGRKVEASTIARLREISAAEDAVRPHVGKMSVACDSGADVYRQALHMLGVDTKGMHPDAFPHVLSATAASRRTQTHQIIAHDSASNAGDFNKMFPDAARIHVS